MALKDIKIRISENTWMEQQLRKDPMGFFSYIDTFMERHLTAGDTNIPRQVFLKWTRNRLLPDQSENEAGWRRFSFLEYFWLKIIQMMEKYNIPVRAMQKVKEELFTTDTDAFLSFCFQSLDKFEGKEEMFKNLPAEVVKFLNDAKAVKNAFSEMAKDITPFMFIFLELMRRSSVAALLIDVDGNCEFVCFNEINEKETLQKMPERFSQTFVSINLNELLSDFYISNKVELEYYKTVELLNEQEVEIIKAVRALDIKELTIKFDKGSNSILIEKISDRDVKRVRGKVDDLSKRGMVTDIRLVFDKRGTLRLFQEKEQRKINTVSNRKKL